MLAVALCVTESHRVYFKGGEGYAVGDNGISEGPEFSGYNFTDASRRRNEAEQKKRLGQV